MLIRLKVLEESVDSEGKSLQARGPVPDVSPSDLTRVAQDLEGGARVRFYRGGPPCGRVTAARSNGDTLWLKLRVTSRSADIWKLVETGAVKTIEIQPLSRGVDVFLKSIAATYDPSYIR